MTDHQPTELDLNRYLDGDLSDEERDAMHESLRTSPELRAALEAIRATDDAMIEAFDREVHVTHVINPRPVIALAAAVLVLAVSGTWWLTRPGHVPTTPTLPEIVSIDPAPAPMASTSTPSRVQVVFEIPIRRAETDANDASAPATPTVATSTADLRRALARGSVDEALQLIDAAAPAERHEAFRVIGKALGSAWTAERVLDRLPPADQLEVCRAWAVDRRFLPETFDRLSALAANPAVRDRFDDVMRELSTRTELTPWMRSHGLTVRGAVAPSSTERNPT